MLDKIEELKKVREQRTKLELREKELTEPILKDVSLIPIISNWVSDLKPMNTRFSDTHYFIAVIALLYSPTIFIGDFLSKKSKIRETIAYSLGRSKTSISDHFQIVGEWYLIYKDFQQDVDYLSIEVKCRIEEYGISEN